MLSRPASTKFGLLEIPSRRLWTTSARPPREGLRQRTPAMEGSTLLVAVGVASRPSQVPAGCHALMKASVTTMAAYVIEIATGMMVISTATGRPPVRRAITTGHGRPSRCTAGGLTAEPGMRKGRSVCGHCTRRATKLHMKRMIDGTESSIENSTRSAYGNHTSSAAHDALKTMYAGAMPAAELLKSHRTRGA